MKKFFTVLTIALSIMQSHAQQTEIRRSEYRIMDDDGNFKNVVQLEIGGRYFYDIDENTHTAIFKRWYGRENDTELIIPSSIDYNGVTYKVVALGDEAGNQNEKLEKVIIPEGVTRIKGFAYCHGLKNITIPSSVKEIGSNAFKECVELESVVLPEGLSTLGYRAFYNCVKLKSIVIPSSVARIESGVFYNCQQLSSITIPSTISEIGEEVFYNCTSLKKVELPRNLTALNGSVFQNCSSLVEIVIPEGVTKIDSGLFYSCNSLTDIYCYSDMPPEIDGSLYGVPLEQVTVHVPVVKKYKKDISWKAFGKLVPILWL